MRGKAVSKHSQGEVENESINWNYFVHFACGPCSTGAMNTLTSLASIEGVAMFY